MPSSCVRKYFVRRAKRTQRRATATNTANDTPSILNSREAIRKPLYLDHSAQRVGSAAHQLFCTIEVKFAMAEIEMFAVVALLEDVPEKGLLRGQVGTVVESLAPGVYEVEFSDDSGQTYASLALRSDQLMRLHHEPSHQAA
jgi:hypothetical protein